MSKKQHHSQKPQMSAPLPQNTPEQQLAQQQIMADPQQDSNLADDKQKVAPAPELDLVQPLHSTPVQTTEGIQTSIKDEVQRIITLITSISLVQMILTMVTDFFSRPVIAHIIESIINVVPTTFSNKKAQIVATVERIALGGYNTITYAVAYVIHIFLSIRAEPNTAKEYARSLPAKAKVVIMETKDHVIEEAVNIAAAKKEEVIQMATEQKQRIVAASQDHYTTASTYVSDRFSDLKTTGMPYIEPYQAKFEHLAAPVQTVQQKVQQLIHFVKSTFSILVDRLFNTVALETLDAKQQNELLRPRLNTESILQYTINQGTAVVRPLFNRVFHSAAAPQSTNP